MSLFCLMFFTWTMLHVKVNKRDTFGLNTMRQWEELLIRCIVSEGWLSKQELYCLLLVAIREQDNHS